MKRISSQSKIRPRGLFLLGALTISVLAVIYFSQSVSAVNITWDGGGATNNWSEAANWSGDTVPGSGDIAVFDGTSTKDATIDAAFAGSVAGMQINAGYTGTITQASGVSLTVGSSGYTQTVGTFNAASTAVVSLSAASRWARVGRSIPTAARWLSVATPGPS